MSSLMTSESTPAARIAVPNQCRMTKKGQAFIAAGIATVNGIEEQLTDRLGERVHRQLRNLLTKLLDDGDA